MLVWDPWNSYIALHMNKYRDKIRHINEKIDVGIAVDVDTDINSDRERGH